MEITPKSNSYSPQTLSLDECWGATKNKDAAKILLRILHEIHFGSHAHTVGWLTAYRIRGKVRSYYARLSVSMNDAPHPGAARYQEMFRARKKLEKAGIDVLT